MTTLAAQMQALSPILITAPTARNGVTLLQRLLNSSRQVIIYGENTLLMDQLPAMVHTMTATYRSAAAELLSARSRLLAGETEGWTSNLWPDAEAFMLCMFDAFYRATAVYEQSTLEYGHTRWGLKMPMCHSSMVERWRVLMPRTQIIAIVRDPCAVIRSARARRFVTDEPGALQYARQWSEHVRVLLEGRERLLLLRHEDLAGAPEDWIPRLESFTGISGIDRSVMSRRFNSFDGYIAPEPLQAREERSIRQITAPMEERLASASVAPAPASTG